MDETMGTTPEERKAVFERVWKRVMEGREGESPVVTWDDMDTPEEPENRPGRGSLQEEEPAPLLPACPAGKDRPHSDFPNGSMFLGEDCMDCIPMLQEMIRRELADWREYQALARRTGGSQARQFQALAEAEKRHAKRLCGACFLISGVRYWPDGGRSMPQPSYLGALRRRFRQEQEAMAAYLAGAEATADPCLQELFREHAKEEWEHACRIRAMVEQV